MNKETYTLPDEINTDVIKDWALMFPSRALELGKRLIQGSSDPKAIADLPSLGDDEDRLIEWAQAHQMKARITLLGLMPRILAKAKAEKEQAEKDQAENEGQSSVV